MFDTVCALAVSAIPTCQDDGELRFELSDIIRVIKQHQLQGVPVGNGSFIQPVRANTSTSRMGPDFIHCITAV